jgi:hypothetical protein
MDSYQLGIGSSRRNPPTFGINHIFSHHEFKRARIEPEQTHTQNAATTNESHEGSLKNKTDEVSESIAKESTNKETTSPPVETSESKNSETGHQEGPPQDHPGKGEGHGHGRDRDKPEHPTKPTTPGGGPPASPGKSNEVHPKHDVPKQPDIPKQEHDHPKPKDSEIGESSEVRGSDGSGRARSGSFSTDHKPSPESGNGSSSTTAEHE